MAAALIALMLLELLLLLFWGTDLLPHRHRPVQPAHGQLVFYIGYRIQRRRYVEVVESVCARVRSDSRDGSLTQAGRSTPCVDDAPAIHSFRIGCMECDQRTLHRAGPISVQISPAR